MKKLIVSLEKYKVVENYINFVANDVASNNIVRAASKGKIVL